MLKKRNLKFLILSIIIVISAAAVFISCDTDQSDDGIGDIGYKSISIQGPEEINAGAFDFSAYTVILRKADGTSDEFVMSKDMISSEDLAKLEQIGKHRITVSYLGLSTTLIIKVNAIDYDISSIKFESKTFEYDGTAKSLEIVGNLPSGIRVEYIGNGQTEIGTYTVTARFIIENDIYEPIDDMVATLSIVAPVYEVSFDLKGGTSEKEFVTLNVTSVTKDDFAFDLVKSGWSFRGWSLNGVIIFDSKGNQLNEIKYSKKMIFVAEFNQKAVLTIEQKLIFEGELIDIAEETGVLTGEGEYNYNTNVNLSARPYDGYKFVGWYYQGLALSNQQDYKYMMWDKDITLQAVYEYSKYDLNVFSNDQSLGKVMVQESGEFSYTESQTYRAYYTQQITVAAYTETDVRFLGWYTEDNTLVSTNAVYTFVMPNSNYKLQAVWNKFNITYELNGGTNNVDNPITFSIEDLPLTLKEATKLDCVFENWYTDSELTNQITQITQIGDIEVFAKFVQLQPTEGLQYQLSDDGTYYSISGYLGSSDSVVISDTYQGLPIKEISESAFSDCSNLKSVTIPSLLTRIGDRAFYNCSSVTSITVPSSVTSIGSEAFKYCSSLKEVHITDIAAWCNIAFSDEYANPLGYANRLYFNNKMITDLVVPDGVTSIGSYTFFNYTWLGSVTIPDSVISIGNEAFSNCTWLIEVNISEGVKSIGKYAFSNCEWLTKIIIPASVTYIEYNAFEYCRNLTNIIFEYSDNWQISRTSDFSTYTELSESDLSDRKTAAKYLTSSYSYYYWRRVE